MIGFKKFVSTVYKKGRERKERRDDRKASGLGGASKRYLSKRGENVREAHTSGEVAMKHYIHRAGDLDHGLAGNRKNWDGNKRLAVPKSTPDTDRNDRLSRRHAQAAEVARKLFRRKTGKKLTMTSGDAARAHDGVPENWRDWHKTKHITYPTERGGRNKHVREDAVPANCVGNAKVDGIGVGPKGEPGFRKRRRRAR